MTSERASVGRANRRLTVRLLLVTAAMFAFGYALVPLYDIVCDLTGFNGRTGVVAEARGPADASRLVKVQFVTTVNTGLDWSLEAPPRPLEVHPGGVYEVTFTATNRTGRSIVGQAVPSVSPVAAAVHFNKIECFCFTRQRLGPGESRPMPVRFVVDADLPRRIGTLTLGYTFFETDAEPTSESAARTTAASDGIRING